MHASRGSLAVHLVRRFAGSLRPGGPAAPDEEWATAHLVPGERALWCRLSGADRRHAIGVARRTVATLGPRADRTVVAAALLHDVGKVESGLGPVWRAAATVLTLVAGRSRVKGWAGRPGMPGRLGRYAAHDEIGARLLVDAGSAELTRAWAREHHRPHDRWTLPPAIAGALEAADDD